MGDYHVYVASPGFNPEEFMKTVVDDTCYNEGEQVTVSLPDVCDDYAGPPFRPKSPFPRPLPSPGRLKAGFHRIVPSPTAFGRVAATTSGL